MIEQRKDHIRSMVAGSIASILSTSISQPLQVIKINLQLTLNRKVNKNRLILETIIKIFEKAGLRGFWRGHITSQCYGILHGVTLFSAYNESTRILNTTRLKDHKHQVDYISGFFAGTCSALLLSPIDLMNTRKIYGGSADRYTSLYKGIKRMTKKHGFLSLYRGILINWIHLGHLIGCKFLLYNIFCHLVGHDDKLPDKHDINAFKLFICGAVAGLLSCTITFPCEVIKRQFHVSTLRKNKICNSIGECAKSIYINEGIQGFFRGLSTALSKSCLVSAICFSSYDILIPLLHFVIQ